MSKKQDSIRSVGLLGATSVVVGSMIGSGILVVSSQISFYGGLGLLAWFMSAMCAMCLAYSFSVMSRKFKEKSGIPYYAFKAFNSNCLGSGTAWLHWTGMTMGCATVAIAFANYLPFLLSFLPAYGKCFAAIMIVWTLTFLNMRSSVFSVGLITFITITKATLLLLLVISSLGYFNISSFVAPSMNPSIIKSVLQAMPLALFAFLGLESATASGDSVKNPEKTLPIATLLGTAIAALIFITVHMSVMSVLPQSIQVGSMAPVADVAMRTMGSMALLLVSFMACFGLIGSINGLLFVSSYILYNASMMNWISKRFSKLNKNNFPACSLMTSALMITAIMCLYYLGFVNMAALVYIDAFLLVSVYFIGSIAYKIHGGNSFVFLANISSCLIILYGCISAYFI